MCMRLYRSAPFSLLLALLFLPWPARAGVQAGHDELLNRLIAQNEASRLRIHSYIVEQEWKTIDPYQPGGPEEIPKEDMVHLISLRVSYANGQWFATRNTHSETVSSGWKEDRSEEAVLNENCFAHCMRDQQPTVYLWDHRSLREMQRQAGVFSQSFLRPAAMELATGADDLTLKQIVDRSTERAVWSVEKTLLDGETVYAVTQTVSSKDGRKRECVFYLDPAKDGLLRRMVAKGNDGELLLERTVVLQYLPGAKAWFPKSVHEKNHADTMSEYWLTVKTVELNPALEPSLFSLPSIEVAENARMRRYPKEGAKSIEYRYRDGQWVAD